MYEISKYTGSSMLCSGYYVLFQVKECALTRYPFTKCAQQMWLPLHCMCVHLLCSFLVFSLVRLVVGVAVLAVGVAVFLARGVAVLLAVGMTVLAVSVAIPPAGGVTVLAGGVVVLLAVGVAVLLAGDVAVLLAVGMLDVRSAPLTATTLMVFLVPLCSPVKL